MKIKKLVLLLMMGITMGMFTSCNFLDEDEDDSLHDVWIGFGLIQKEANAESFTIKLDNGSILNPTNASYWNEDVHHNQRVFANFAIIEEKEEVESVKQYDVRINSLRNILYKGILDITPAIEDSIGHDPIHVSDKWLVNNMLNFELQYLGGSQVHFINLVKQPNAAPNDTVMLEIRHNNNDDLDKVRMSAIVTFDLTSLQVTGKDSILFKVTARDFYDETFEYVGYYKY